MGRVYKADIHLLTPNCFKEVIWSLQTFTVYLIFVIVKWTNVAHSVLTWRWKVEKWMSGMKRTGCVSKSIIVLKMVKSLRLCRRGTLTSGPTGINGARTEWNTPLTGALVTRFCYKAPSNQLNLHVKVKTWSRAYSFPKQGWRQSICPSYGTVSSPHHGSCALHPCRRRP